MQGGPSLPSPGDQIHLTVAVILLVKDGIAVGCARPVYRTLTVSRESHQASLSIPTIQEAISKGRPLIAGFDLRVDTIPIGGLGLTRGRP